MKERYKMDKQLIYDVSQSMPNIIYRNNLQATEELMNLLVSLSKNPLNDVTDYLMMYDMGFFTFQTWEKLLQSENECSDGLTEEQCKEQIGKSIWQLPCGWYVQYV